MIPELTIVRGLPGSGKSTYARTLDAVLVETDQWMVGVDGEYLYQPHKLPEYHGRCFRSAMQMLEQGQNVVVANVFSRIHEISPYVLLATGLKTYCTLVQICVEMTPQELARRGVHGVPASSIARTLHHWESPARFPSWFPHQQNILL